MIRRPPRSTLSSSSAASDVYKRQAIEIMFNAVIVAAVAMSRYVTPAALRVAPASTDDAVAQMVLTGQVFAIFIVAVAAAEVALGLAIVIVVYRARGTVDLTKVNLLRR